MINFLKKQPVLATAPRFKDRAVKGFTIIEVLIVLAILSIALGTIYKSFAQLNRSYTTENVKAGVQQGARIAVEFMVQDIRLAGLDPLGTANAGVAAGVPLPTSNWIEFTADANFDGEIVDTDQFEKIKYELVGNKLKQTNHLSQETMLDNVTNLSFTFLDADDQIPTTNDEIRSVIVSLTMERPAGRAEPISRTYTTTVRCRNL
jgi:type IV pilus assembly protein PilW